MATSTVAKFSAENFAEEVLDSDQPVLVDFYAEWCPPCKMLAPTIDSLADDYAGKAVVGKVDTDEQNELAAALNITSLPTLLVFKDGNVVNKIVGYTSKDVLASAIDEHL